MNFLKRLFKGSDPLEGIEISLDPLPGYAITAYAKIPEGIMPLDRVEKYQIPLGEALEQEKLGIVTGGGTMLREDQTIEYVGVDLQLVNVHGAIEFTKQKLRELGAPRGSALQYRHNGVDVVDPIYDREERGGPVT
jgi:hypothetical protein